MLKGRGPLIKAKLYQSKFRKIKYTLQTSLVINSSLFMGVISDFLFYPHFHAILSREHLLNKSSTKIKLREMKYTLEESLVADDVCLWEL